MSTRHNRHNTTLSFDVAKIDCANDDDDDDDDDVGCGGGVALMKFQHSTLDGTEEETHMSGCCTDGQTNWVIGRWIDIFINCRFPGYTYLHMYALLVVLSSLADTVVPWQSNV